MPDHLEDLEHKYSELKSRLELVRSYL